MMRLPGVRRFVVNRHGDGTACSRDIDRSRDTGSFRDRSQSNSSVIYGSHFRRSACLRGRLFSCAQELYSVKIISQVCVPVQCHHFGMQ